MKFKSLFITALVASSVFATSALARDNVSTQYDRWEQSLRSRVETLHVYPQGAEKGATGDVLVRFRIGGNGKPADITIVRSSGQAIFDTAAVRLVGKLGRLGPVPSANAGVETVTLKLSFGGGASFEDDKRIAARDVEERTANERRNRTIVSRAERLAGKR